MKLLYSKLQEDISRQFKSNFKGNKPWKNKEGGLFVKHSFSKSWELQDFRRKNTSVGGLRALKRKNCILNKETNFWSGIISGSIYHGKQNAAFDFGTCVTYVTMLCVQLSATVTLDWRAKLYLIL